jgi:hypothetical protein
MQGGNFPLGTPIGARSNLSYTVSRQTKLALKLGNDNSPQQLLFRFNQFGDPSNWCRFFQQSYIWVPRLMDCGVEVVKK